MKGFELIAALTSKWREAGRNAPLTPVVVEFTVGGQVEQFAVSGVDVRADATALNVRRVTR